MVNPVLFLLHVTNVLNYRQQVIYIHLHTWCLFRLNMSLGREIAKELYHEQQKNKWKFQLAAFQPNKNEPFLKGPWCF